MKKHTLFWLGAAVSALIACTTQPQGDDAVTLRSPDGDVKVTVQLDEQGQPRYQVYHDEQALLEPSVLGMELSDADLRNGLSLVSVSDSQLVEDRYRLKQGKRLDYHYVANERTLTFANEEGRELAVIFRASDDGVAFRYHFPGESEGIVQVIEENTSFHFPESARGWLQQMQVVNTGWEGTNPAYEEHYEMDIPVGEASPSEAGWVFPALFKSGDTWVLLSEVGMQSNFHASRLQAESPGGEYRVGHPMDEEVYTGGGLMAEDERPFSSPWRTITVGSLREVTASSMGTDLAEPQVEMNTDFIKPGVASWSWGLLKEPSITYDLQKKFIDYAADMEWEYTLIDVNWDETIGYEGIQELVDYAAGKEVGVILWYNSSGEWNTSPFTPKGQLLERDQRRAEFERISDMGVVGVKIDFFPGDGRSSIAYYREILEDAADFELMVNHHGSTLPRGIHRTYPHMMTMESVHGMEMVTFFQETADQEAEHAAMLPFARNVFDPMDYTPTVFHDLMNPEVERKTTNGFQLALPVIFLSGIEHIVETPEGMATVPDYIKNFMRDLPVVWDESRLVEGYPGKLAVFARRKGDTWYVAGINGEQQAKTLALDLGFIGSNNGVLMTDGDRPRQFERRELDSNRIEVELKPAGGFVAVYR
ncbi:glycoside hydrolase family 97 protein [Marinimicrobium sp. C2-29]|uniref:glycoside hydrolase family 97 protein n=1 Tax=Marinimicrobium sp. C2-29 TaxID=3139825 RepID=UPI003138AF69